MYFQGDITGISAEKASLLWTAYLSAIDLPLHECYLALEGKALGKYALVVLL